MPTKRYTVGFLIDDLLSRYQVRLFSGLRQAGRRHDFRIIGLLGGHFAQGDNSQFDGSFLYELATPRALDGLIVGSNVLAAEVGVAPVREYCRRRGIPVVSVGKLAGIPAVDADHERGMRDLVRHLVVDHRLTRLAFIQGSKGNPHSQEREAAFRQVLAEHDIVVHEDWILPGDFLESSGARAICQLFEDQGVPLDALDAVVAANDHMAVGALRELQSRGVKVPQQLAIVGFDDDVATRTSDPTLTTVAQPVERIGAAAGDLLLRILGGEAPEETVLVGTEVIIRGSCGCGLATQSRRLAACSSAHAASRVLDCRQACLARIQDFLFEPIGVAGLDACLAFIAGSSDADRELTFAAIEKAISETSQAGLHPLRWHDVLRPVAITLERRAAAGSSVEPLQHRLLQVQERVSAVSARLEAQERIRTAQEGNALRVLGGALVSARGLGAIGPVLEAALPGLGVSLCYVCLFDHEVPSPRQATVVVRYAPLSIDRGVLMHRTAELWQELPRSVPPPPPPRARTPSTQFEIPDLLPPKIAIEVKYRDLLVYPLVFARDGLGYVVFDPPERLAGAWVLDGVASHLSSALHTILNSVRLRDAREAAEAASAAKSEFVAIMSHEIRTPMTAMLGHLELCLRTQLTRDQRHHVEQARISSRALLEIVNDLLDFSKVEAQRLELERERFSLDDVLAHVANTCGVAAASKNLELVIDVERYVPDMLFGDSLRLGQVLTNLVGNAIKFSASGVVVLDVVRTHPSATDEVLLTFSVKDSGIGMSEEQLARVFQPFAQADSSTTRRYGGTGLGLTIAQRFVRLMGGELEVKSRPTEGSVFSFTATFDRDHSEAPEPQEGVGVRVLIVEDCARQRDALKRMLQARAYTVDTADNPEHALNIVNAGTGRLVYHLVLVDETLPGMSGRALAREFHRHYAVIRGPIVLLGQRTADAAGIDDTCRGDVASMVFKPVSRSTLRDLGRSAGRMRVDVQPPPHLAKRALPELIGCRVLLVQDDPVSRDALREMLRLYGMRVDTAGDGGAVLRLCRTILFDVVLLDLGLPGVDGYTVCAALRMDARYSHVPIIALTASSGVEVRQRSLAAGMNDCVTTPVEAERLASLIAVSLRDPGPAMVEGLRRTQSSAALEAVRPPAELDATAAVKRLGGNRGLFRRLLRRFIEDQQEAVARVRRWLEAGDRPRVERYAHSLVSAAGNVGAMQLSAAAHALEITLRRRIGDPPPQVLEDFEVALAAALRAADEALGRLSADEIPAVVVDDVLPALRTLRGLLTAYDTRAVEYLDRLLPAVTAVAGNTAVRRLDQSIRGYDFAAALSELDRLADIVKERTGAKS